MPPTQVYFKDWCPYSQKALKLLKEKNVDFEGIDVTNDLEREFEMRERAGRTSVPQIFVGDLHLGGYDDIAALDRAGRLDAIIGSTHDKAA
ncbi:MAG: glutaredoxin 3 [Woeseiaceae bacterium]